jgi:hypothetical protein
LEVAPKKLFGAFGGVVMPASSGRQEAQPQFFATPRLVQIAPQGIAHQSRNRELLSLGQKAELTLRGFFEKQGRPSHMTYDVIPYSRGSVSLVAIHPINFIR